MITDNRYFKSLVPTTGGGTNGVGWEFSPEHHERKTSANIYLNTHYRQNMKKLC